MVRNGGSGTNGKTMIGFIGIALSLMIPLLSFSGVAVGAWTEWRGDASHRADEDGKIPQKGQIIWDFETGGQVYSSPVFYQGNVLIGSDDGFLHCLNASTGEKVWKFATGAEVQSTALVIGERAYFGSFDRNIYCIALPEKGERPTLIWNESVKGKIIGSCHRFDDSVIFTDNSGFLHRFSLEGERLFSSRVSEREFWATPVVENGTGTGIVGDVGNTLFRVDLNDGSILESRDFSDGSEFYSSGLLEGGVFYIPDGEGRTLHALDPVDLSTIWSFSMGHPSYSSPVIEEDRLYFGSFEYLWCLPVNDPDGNGNISHQEVIWSSATHDFQGGSSPLVSGGRIYIGSDDYHLYCFDIRDGEMMWRAETGGYIYSSPSLFNGSIFIGSLDRSVYSVGDRPPGLVVEVGLEPREIVSDEVSRMSVRIINETGHPVRDAKLNIDTSAGRVLFPGTDTTAETIVVANGSVVLELDPIRVSSRSTMDITLEAEKEGMSKGATTAQLIVEPGEGPSSDEVKVDTAADRGPYYLGLSLVVLVNIILLSILVLFSIRNYNLRREGN